MVEVMRYIYFHCHSLNTVKDIKGQQTMHGKIIIHTEGFLFILTLDTDKKKEDYLNNLYKSVYLVDVLERHKVKKHGRV